MPRNHLPPFLTHYRRPNPWPARIASLFLLAALAGGFLFLTQ